MPTKNNFVTTLRQLEAKARQQLSALKKRAERELPRVPIGPGPRKQLLKAVRTLRTELNRNLLKLERSLAPPKAKPRKSAKR